MWSGRFKVAHYLALLVLASVLLAGNRAVTAPVTGRQPGASFAKVITPHSPVLYPNSLAARDLNGDGFADVAVVSSDSGIAPPSVHFLLEPGPSLVIILNC